MEHHVILFSNPATPDTTIGFLDYEFQLGKRLHNSEDEDREKEFERAF